MNSEKLANLINTVVGRDGQRLRLIKFVQSEGSTDMTTIANKLGVKATSQVSGMLRDLRNLGILSTSRNADDARNVTVTMGDDIPDIVYTILEACEDETPKAKPKAKAKAKPKVKPHQSHQRHPVAAGNNAE
jgi:predicted transcriptional regulator